MKCRLVPEILSLLNRRSRVTKKWSSKAKVKTERTKKHSRNEDAPSIPNKIRSRKEEVRFAKQVGGRRQVNSGAGPFTSQKGDIKNGMFLFEHKLTNKDRFTFTFDVIRKAVQEARQEGKVPALVMKLEGIPEELEQEWVCIPTPTFRILIGEDDG